MRATGEKNDTVAGGVEFCTFASPALRENFVRMVAKKRRKTPLAMAYLFPDTGLLTAASFIHLVVGFLSDEKE